MWNTQLAGKYFKKMGEHIEIGETEKKGNVFHNLNFYILGWLGIFLIILFIENWLHFNKIHIVTIKFD